MHLILARNSLNLLHHIEPGNKFLSFLCSWLQFGWSHLDSAFSSTEQGLLESSRTWSESLLDTETGILVHAGCNWMEYKKKKPAFAGGHHTVTARNPREQTEIIFKVSELFLPSIRDT